MLTCKKCGLELHEDQKVCIQCGTRTIRGDGFDYEQKTFKITRNMKIGAGVVALAIVVMIVLNALKVTPPDQTANTWFAAMVARDTGVASDMVTPELKQYYEDRGMDIRALADEYNGEVQGYNAKYSLTKLAMKGENLASIELHIVYPDGNQRIQTLELIKQGRKWLINKIQ